MHHVSGLGASSSLVLRLLELLKAERKVSCGKATLGWLTFTLNGINLKSKTLLGLSFRMSEGASTT